MAVFNAVVDPHGILSLLDIKGFNSQKVVVAAGGRSKKAMMVRNCSYQAMLFGSSRVEAAMDPEATFFRGKSTFNMAFPGSNFVETRNAMRFARQRQPDLRTVIIGLDYELFTAVMGPMDDYRRSPLAERLALAALGPSMLSISSARDSIQTLIANATGAPADCTFDGYFDVSLSNLNTRASFEGTIDYFLREPWIYGAFDYSPDRVAWLREELLEFAAADVRIFLFIPPQHALNLLVLDALGMWDGVERWKRELVAVVAAVNSKVPPERQIQLLDFSGFNSVTTEPVPKNDNPYRMDWWNDSSHFRKPIGDVIFDRLAKPPNGSMRDQKFPDFGRVLTKLNLDEVLEDQRRAKSDYIVRNPDLVALVKQRLAVAGKAGKADWPMSSQFGSR